MQTLRVNAEDRAALEATMVEIVRRLRRMPSHWEADRGRLHSMLDELLTDWQRATQTRS